MKKREKEDVIYLKILGSRIKKIRLEKGISQVDLSYSCEIEKTNMNRIEAGNTNPTILMLKKICNGLGITLSELFDFVIE